MLSRDSISTRCNNTNNNDDVKKRNNHKKKKHKRKIFHDKNYYVTEIFHLHLKKFMFMEMNKFGKR
jgi:hypothetical protein